MAGKATDMRMMNIPATKKGTASRAPRLGTAAIKTVEKMMTGTSVTSIINRVRPA
jgi:hypothetical protein